MADSFQSSAVSTFFISFQTPNIPLMLRDARRDGITPYQATWCFLLRGALMWTRRNNSLQNYISSQVPRQIENGWNQNQFLFARGLWLKSVICISSFSFVLLSAPFASHQKWESHRNHLGITWDLRPSWSPCIGGKLLGDGSLPMQGDLEGLFLIHDAKLLNPELAVRT